MSRTLPEKIGRYRPTAEIGRGGMGVVYRAEDPELHREVAVKVILFPPGADPGMRSELEARFRREARAAAGIHHPGVITVHDVGRDGDYLFLVMELIDGDSLADRLRRGPRPTRHEAFGIAARVAEALAAAHARGVAHRDVTPRNILLSKDGRVVVTDFGIARSFGDQGTELTRTGMLVGSPSYVAPEQAQGKAVDERADVFSLGVVLFEMLIGDRPFKSADVTSVLYQIVHEDPLARKGIRETLGPSSYALLRKCLEKSPEQRLRDATTAAREILRLRDEQEGIVTENLPPTAYLGRDGKTVPRHPVRRRPRGAIVGALAALALLAVLFWFWKSPPGAPVPGERLAGAAELPDDMVLTEADPAPASADLSMETETEDPETDGSEPPAAFVEDDPPPPPASPPPVAPPPPAVQQPLQKTEPEPAEAALEAPPPLLPDSFPPVLAIDDPSVTDTGTLVLTGRVADDRDGVRLTVDGVAVEVGEDGRFEVEPELEPGRNSLALVATDAAGNRTARMVEVAPSASLASAGDETSTDAPPPDQAVPAAGPRRRGRFADRGDGTLVDTVTGLMWAKRGDGNSHAWKSARNYCRRSKLADHRDWRLPMIGELEDLHIASVSPGSGLSLAGIPEPVWSSTKDGSSAWSFDYAAGQKGESPTGTELRVLCVRRLPARQPGQDSFPEDPFGDLGGGGLRSAPPGGGGGGGRPPGGGGDGGGQGGGGGGGGGGPGGGGGGGGGGRPPGGGGG